MTLLYVIVALLALAMIGQTIAYKRQNKEIENLSNDLEIVTTDCRWAMNELQKQAQIFVDIDERNAASLEKVNARVDSVTKNVNFITRRYCLYKDTAEDIAQAAIEKATAGTGGVKWAYKHRAKEDV